MEALILIVAAVLVLTVFDFAAVRWGVDSRDYSGRRNWW